MKLAWEELFCTGPRSRKKAWCSTAHFHRCLQALGCSIRNTKVCSCSRPCRTGPRGFSGVGLGRSEPHMGRKSSCMIPLLRSPSPNPAAPGSFTEPSKEPIPSLRTSARWFMGNSDKGKTTTLETLETRPTSRVLQHRLRHGSAGRFRFPHSFPKPSEEISPDGLPVPACRRVPVARPRTSHPQAAIAFRPLTGGRMCPVTPS